MSQTKTSKQVASKTMAIKARVYNQTARYFNRKDEKYNKDLMQILSILQGQKNEESKKTLLTLLSKDPKKITDLALLVVDIKKIVNEGHAELRAYKQKRKTRAHVQAERIARGVKPKRRTSKAEWEKMQTLKQSA